MLIPILFSIAAIILGFRLSKHFLSSSSMHHEDFKFLTLCVGLWNLFTYGLGVFAALYSYSSQGKESFLASETPASINPAMTLFEFLKEFVPAGFGLASAIFYVVFAYNPKTSNKIRTACSIAICADLFARVCFLSTIKILSLPTFGQMLTSALLFLFPWIICTLFSIYWLLLLQKKQVGS